jgi:signal peptidase
MGFLKWTRVFVELAVFFVLLSLLIGPILGEPVLLTYVKTDSMEPTLSSGDGFVAIPTQLDGSIDEGDVVVFDSKQIQGGGLTTHRVTGTSDAGYITKGDANPFTDQDSGEPPVNRGQVVAKALQINGRVVVLPGAGRMLELARSVLSTANRFVANLFGTKPLFDVQGFGYLLFGVALAWYVVGELRQTDSKRFRRVISRRNGTDVRLFVGAFTAILVFGATASMVVPAGTQEYGIVSSEFESDSANVIVKGETASQPYLSGNGGLLPVVAFLEPSSDGVDVEPGMVVVPARSTVNATVTFHSPPETGYYRRYVTEHRYLAVLPRSTIRGLYEVHPRAPIFVIDAVIAVPFYLLGVRLAGRSRLRRERSREPSRSMLTRARVFVTDLY